MFIDASRSLLLCLPLLFTVTASAQQHNAPTEPVARLYLDVVVTGKSGAPVTGLQQQDFTLLDNKTPRTIASFQALGGSQAPIEVILVIDAVNTGVEHVGYELQAIEKFLHADGAHLAYPTALVVFTDEGTKLQSGFSQDGNALGASLDHYVVGLRAIRRSAGFYGAAERFQLSLEALQQLATREASRPGRKIFLCVSPGWPLLSGPGVELGSKDQQQIFSEIVTLSTQFLQGHITLYSIDPLGTADFGGHAFFWEDFVKGISKPSQVDIGDLALQVIAVQSGGLALNFSNDVPALLQKCLADASAYYELSFDAPIGDQPHEYHHLEVNVAKPGLTARTRQGYYSQP